MQRRKERWEKETQKKFLLLRNVLLCAVLLHIQWRRICERTDTHMCVIACTKIENVHTLEVERNGSVSPLSAPSQSRSKTERRKGNAKLAVVLPKRVWVAEAGRGYGSGRRAVHIPTACIIHRRLSLSLSLSTKTDTNSFATRPGALVCMRTHIMELLPGWGVGGVHLGMHHQHHSSIAY